MSVQITTAFVEHFKANVEHKAQQMSSFFAGKVREESITPGKIAFFEQLGAVSAVKRTARHADTPRVDSKHRRRSVFPEMWEISDLIDEDDKVKMLIDPQGPYAESFAMALTRAEDQTVIDAATGTAYADETGTGAGTMSAQTITNTVAVNYVASGSPANSGLTLAKLIAAKSYLGKASAPKGTPMYFVHRQAQLDDLLNNVSQVSSSDYANVKALVEGEVNRFMGFEFINVGTDSSISATLENVASTGVTTCFAYSKIGLLLGKAIGRTVRIDQLPTKSYSTQVYAAQSQGATRMQESMVVPVYCDEVL